MNAIDYLKLVDEKRNTPFTITDGQGFYKVNGELVPAKEFERSYPVPLQVRPDPTNFKGENPDKTKDWMT